MEQDNKVAVKYLIQTTVPFSRQIYQREDHCWHGRMDNGNPLKGNRRRSRRRRRNFRPLCPMDRDNYAFAFAAPPAKDSLPNYGWLEIVSFAFSVCIIIIIIILVLVNGKCGCCAAKREEMAWLCDTGQTECVTHRRRQLLFVGISASSLSCVTRGPSRPAYTNVQ